VPIIQYAYVIVICR